MNTHTPGPWTAWDDDGTGTLPCVLSESVTNAGNFYVAQCNVFEDARLIAAAPDLLAACEAALDDWHSHPRNFYRQEPGYLAVLRAAIAKAREG